MQKSHPDGDPQNRSWGIEAEVEKEEEEGEEEEEDEKKKIGGVLRFAKRCRYCLAETREMNIA